MRKIIFILSLIISTTSYAQLVDLIGGLSVQGSMDAAAYQSISDGMSALNRMQLIQNLQQAAMEIKTSYFGHYQNVSRSSVSSASFPKISWTVGPQGNNYFYIQFNQINQSDCQYLLSQGTGTIRIEVNGSGTTCSNNNTIRFIYD